MTRRLLDWFTRRPRLAVAAALTYFLVVSATHDQVQDLAYSLQRTFGAGFWGPFVGALALAAGGLAAWSVERRCRVHPAGRIVKWYWRGSLFAALGAGALLLATNMESIHFLQYALLAIPVFALTRRFGATVLLVGLLGALDELHQFEVLHAHWGIPFDVNDIVLNTIGGALGAAWLAVWAPVRPRAPAPWRPAFAPVLLAAVLFVAAPVALHAAGRLVLYRTESSPRTWIVLARTERPASRWQEPEWGRSHHLLHPLVGTLLALGLAAAFSALDRRAAVFSS